MIWRKFIHDESQHKRLWFSNHRVAFKLTRLTFTQFFDVYLHIKTSDSNHMIQSKRVVQETCAVAQWRAREIWNKINLTNDRMGRETFLTWPSNFCRRKKKEKEEEELMKNKTNPSPAVECRQCCWNFCGSYLSILLYRRSSHSNCHRP